MLNLICWRTRGSKSSLQHARSGEHDVSGVTRGIRTPTRGGSKKSHVKIQEKTNKRGVRETQLARVRGSFECSALTLFACSLWFLIFLWARTTDPERSRESRDMMGLRLGRRVGSPRLLSPAVALDNKRRGCVVEQVLPATRGASAGGVRSSTSHPRRQFASASFGTNASVARKRGAERIGVRGGYGSFPRCVAVQVAQQGSARDRMHTHTQRRLLSSRDGFGGGQHFPHSDQVRQSSMVTLLQASLLQQTHALLLDC